MTELAQVAWAANLAVIDFHPWPSRRADTEHPDELRIDIDPQPGTDFADAKAVAAIVRETLAEIGYTGWPKTSGNRGIHIACRIEPQVGVPGRPPRARSRSRARSSAARPTSSRRRGGRRSGARRCSSTTTRTPATARSPRPTRCAPRPDAAVSAPVTWDELPDVETEDFTLVSMPPRFAKLGDVQAAIDDTVCDLQVLLEWVERDEAAGSGEAPYPPNFPKMPGEPPRVQPSRARKPEKPERRLRLTQPSHLRAAPRRVSPAARAAAAARPTCTSAGSLSGRNRSSFVPWRKRRPCTLS